MTKNLLLFLILSLSPVGFSSDIFAQTTRPKAKPTAKKTTPKEQSISKESVSVSVSLDKPELIPKNLSPARKRRFETFDLVWKTIKDNYFDATFGGNDWRKVRAEFLPKVLKSKNDLEFHTLLQDLINRLNQSHLMVIPPEAYEEIETAKAESVKREAEKNAKKAQKIDKNDPDSEDDDSDESDEPIYREFGLPLDLRIIDSQVVITSIEKDSNLEKAGVKTGYVIQKVNGISLSDLIVRLRNFNSYSKTFAKQMPAVLKSFLQGEIDSEVELDLLDENNKLISLTIVREGLKGVYITIMQGLPESRFNFESRSIDEKTGYIRFDMFAIPVLRKFCDALTKFKDKDSIIIDLRGNIGGAVSALFGIAGLLSPKSMDIGTAISRSGRQKYLANSMPRSFKGKIAILIDQHSASAAEMFASSFKDAGRGIVIGERSSGAALPSITMNLPTGAVFIYPTANFLSAKGKMIEGIGVEPDFLVPFDRKSLLEGKDAQVIAALKYLSDKKQTPAAAIVNEDNPPPTPRPTPKPIGPPPPAKTTVLPETVEAVQDEKAMQIVRDYVNAIGGIENLKAIRSITAKGSGFVVSGGSNVEGTYDIYREAPNKSAEVLTIDSAGDIREVFDGKKLFSQTIYSGYTEQVFPWINREYELFCDFNEFTDFKDKYQRVTFLGTFERQGKQISLIEATTKDGIRFTFGFDAKTKFLLNRSGRNFNMTFDDYQKIGNVFYPMEQTRNVIIKLKLSKVEFNVPIDEKVFLKEDNCFTKID